MQFASSCFNALTMFMNPPASIKTAISVGCTSSPNGTRRLENYFGCGSSENFSGSEGAMGKVKGRAAKGQGKVTTAIRTLRRFLSINEHCRNRSGPKWG